MRQTQINLFNGELTGVSESSGVSLPDMSKLAFAYGYPYFRIEKLDSVDDIVNQVLAVDGPVICEVLLDSRQFFEPKLSSKVLPDGKIVSPEIDDLYPFLPRDEYERNKIAEKE